MKVVATNRKARHEYTISKTWEAGIELLGTEIKSLRQGKVNLTDGWIDIHQGEAFLRDVHISPYSHGTHANHEPKRQRRLLLHKREINKMDAMVGEVGYTLVPLKIYFKNRWAKVEIGLGKGKKLYDKRQDKKERDAKRQIQRIVKKAR